MGAVKKSQIIEEMIKNLKSNTYKLRSEAQSSNKDLIRYILPLSLSTM